MPNGHIYMSPTGLRSFQAEPAALVCLNQELICTFDTGIGKQAPVSEPVLTPLGWRPIGDIRPGDDVYGADGRPAAVQSVHPQKSRTVYRITFSDGSWTRCGPDHLWTVSRWKTEGHNRVPVSQTLTTEEILQQGLTETTGKRRWWIPQTAPVQYLARELPIDPYALGVILGDGHINADGHVQITTDKEILDDIAPDSSRIWHESEGIELMTTSRWRRELVDLGLARHRSWEKFVPEMYLRAPEADRRALLAGLLDTDGSPMAQGGVEFTSTSEVLAEAVCELVESLGGIARRKGSRVTTYTHNGETRQGRPSWRVNVKLTEDPFRLARKRLRWVEPIKYLPKRLIASITPEPDEDSICIKIDRADGLYLTRHHIVTHNTHVAMAAAAMLFEEDLIDLVLLVGQRNKIADKDEHPAEWAKFTSLSQLVYHGPSRAKKLAQEGVPEVLMTTYETGASELMVRMPPPPGKGKRTKGGKADGPLFEALGLRHKRVLLVLDEISILSNRGAERYRAWEYVVSQLRKTGNQHYFLGLTGNSMKTTYEDSFNQARLATTKMPAIGVFEKEFTRGRDLYNRLVFHGEGRARFSQLFQSVSYRKQLTDPEVRAEMPELAVRTQFVDLHPEHRKFYQAVSQMYEPHEINGRLPDDLQQAINTALQLTAGHPASHLHSSSPLSRAITETMGADSLRAIPCSKLQRLIEERLRPVTDEGHQVLIFTFYAETVLPELERDLLSAGFTVATYTGGASVSANEEAKRAFRAGEVQILLSSDAGSKGLNLPEAHYIIEYEPAKTIETQIQRFGRGTRLGSSNDFVYGITTVLRDTVDVSAYATVKRRGKDKDQLLGDTVA